MLPEPLICGNWLDLVIPRLARASSTRATASCKSKFWARAVRIRACSCSSLKTSNHFRSPSEAGSVAVAASAPRNTAGTLEAGLLYLGPTVHPVSIEAIRNPLIKYLVFILKPPEIVFSFQSPGRENQIPQAMPTTLEVGNRGPTTPGDPSGV